MITIPFNISEENWPMFRDYFLKVMPIPIDNKGDTIISAEKHIENCIMDFALGTARNGWQKKTLESVSPLDNLLGEI